MKPIDPDATFRRREAAEALTKADYPTTYSRLTTLACRGDGPVYRLFGRVALYAGRDLIQWAEGRTTTKGGPANA